MTLSAIFRLKLINELFFAHFDGFSRFRSKITCTFFEKVSLPQKYGAKKISLFEHFSINFKNRSKKSSIFDRFFDIYTLRTKTNFNLFIKMHFYFFKDLYKKKKWIFLSFIKISRDFIKKPNFNDSLTEVKKNLAFFVIMG